MDISQKLIVDNLEYAISQKSIKTKKAIAQMIKDVNADELDDDIESEILKSNMDAALNANSAKVIDHHLKVSKNLFVDAFAKGGHIGFEGLQKDVAEQYEGKSVPPKYQDEYGKRYSHEEAMEVGAKVAAKVAREKGVMEDGGSLGDKIFSVHSHSIGKAKYVIDFFDGYTKHKDGSPQIGIIISRSKKDLEATKKTLRSEGYTEVANVFNSLHSSAYAEGGTISDKKTELETKIRQLEAALKYAPDSAKSKAKEMLDEAKKELSEMDNKNETSVIKSKHPIDYIEILWAEGDNSKYDKFPKKYKTFKEANQALLPILKDVGEEGGYNKVKFNIVWNDKDKSSYEGRLDISPREDNPSITSNVIGEHILDFQNYYLSGEGSKMESEESKIKIKEFLDNFMLEDKKSEPKPEKKKSEPKAKPEPKQPAKPKAKRGGGNEKGASALKKIQAKAKEIRKDGEKWQDAIKRASAIIKGDVEKVEKKAKTVIKRVEKKVAEPKKKTVIKTSKSKPKPKMKTVIQTKRGKKADGDRDALPVGKRISKDGNVYYEYRSNHADKTSDRPKGKMFKKGGKI